MYTKEDLRKAFEAGFHYYPHSDTLFDPSETEQIGLALEEEFEEFLDSLQGELMNNIRFLGKAFKTLLNAWGDYYIPESIWAANDLLNWLNIAYTLNIQGEFLESDEDDSDNINDQLLKEILDSLCHH